VFRLLTFSIAAALYAQDAGSVEGVVVDSVTGAGFAGRVYAPNAIVNSTGTGVSLVFDGYDQGYAAKGNAKDLSSYRNVGQVFLSSGGVDTPRGSRRGLRPARRASSPCALACAPLHPS
jgi:hypothetical protein